MNIIPSISRPSGRKHDELRHIILIPDYLKHAEGSCFTQFGDTHVLCSASVETRVPYWLRDSGKGWVTAEYGMLPRSTNTRINREAVQGKQTGRSQEIQRLIGRSLRAVVDLKLMKDIQIKIDCDVIQADGGTRTAAITGAYIALFKAINYCQQKKLIIGNPLLESVAAVSCGIRHDAAIVDLDYIEDSTAQADANFVLTGNNQIVEVQCTAEDRPLPHKAFQQLTELAQTSAQFITAAQNNALNL